MKKIAILTKDFDPRYNTEYNLFVRNLIEKIQHDKITIFNITSGINSLYFTEFEKYGVYYLNDFVLAEEEKSVDKVKSELENQDCIYMVDTSHFWIFIPEISDVLKSKKIILFDHQESLPSDLTKVFFYRISSQIINTSFYSYLNQNFTYYKRELSKKRQNVYPEFKVISEETQSIEKIINVLSDKYKYIYLTNATPFNLELFWNYVSLFNAKERKNHLLIALNSDPNIEEFYKNGMYNLIQVFFLRSDNKIYPTLFSKDIQFYFSANPIEQFNFYEWYSIQKDIPIITNRSGNSIYYSLKDLSLLKQFSKDRLMIESPNFDYYVSQKDNMYLTAIDNYTFAGKYGFYFDRLEFTNQMITQFYSNNDVDYSDKKKKLTELVFNPDMVYSDNTESDWSVLEEQNIKQKTQTLLGFPNYKTKRLV